MKGYITRYNYDLPVQQYGARVARQRGIQGGEK
jgi:hypothetical protein